MGPILKIPLPKTDQTQAGMKNVVHESSPWSNNSPSGPLVPVLRACFPSIPSRIIEN